jgi:hypothetical protein
VRFLWVPLLLAPAGVVFVGTRTAIEPIASTERLDVVPHIPAAIALPTAAIGITTPAKHVTVRVHTRRPAPHRVVRHRPKVRIVRAPRPVYVVPRTVVTVVTHIAAKTTAPHASHTPKPKPAPKPAPVPTPPQTPAPAEPTTPPPSEPPAQPTPTPAVLPAPAPEPAAPSVAPTEGDDDDHGEDGDGNDTRPGNGFGDRNHEHTGPPGHDGDHGRHGHD